MAQMLHFGFTPCSGPRLSMNERQSDIL